jgi:hypothetical protein
LRGTTEEGVELVAAKVALAEEFGDLGR